MEYNLVELITNVGFPIVCVIAMAWYVKYKTDKQDEVIANMTESHHEEVAELTANYNSEINGIREALNNNTTAVIALTEYIKAKSGD